MKLRLLACLSLSLALPTLVQAQVGGVLRSQKINELFGGFGGALDDDDQFGGFGSSLAALGDLNADGVGDLAAGADGDDDGGSNRGALWILFLNADGSVQSEQKISQTVGGFTGTLADEGRFGARVAGVGDLDGDGIPDLAAVSGLPGRLWALLLNSDGTVKSHAENLYSDPVFQPPTQARFFANGGLCALGDLDGDGLGDLALGAPHDTDGVGADAGALWIVRLAANGTLQAAHKISQTQGGFTGVLEEGDQFGTAIVQLGDLDGDGNRELGVSSPFGSDLGDFWILRLDASEQVIGQSEFGIDDYGLAWPSLITFGTSDEFAWLGDLDGDGVGELASEHAGHNFPGGPDQEGGLAIAFLRSDGSVKKKVRISHQRGGLGDLPGRTGFGSALVALGDLDGDGSPELGVSAPLDRGAGETTGALWILSLDTSAARNGSGLNPQTLTQAAEPVFGTSWSATLDCSGHAPGLAYVFGYSAPSSGSFLPAGEVLVGGTRLFLLQGLHAGGPTVLGGNLPPYTLALIDLPVHIQGLCTGAPAAQLSNALDVVLSR